MTSEQGSNFTKKISNHWYLLTVINKDVFFSRQEIEKALSFSIKQCNEKLIHQKNPSLLFIAKLLHRYIIKKCPAISTIRIRANTGEYVEYTK